MKTYSKVIHKGESLVGGFPVEGSNRVEDVAPELAENMDEEQVPAFGIYKHTEFERLIETKCIPASTRLPGGGRKPRFNLPYNKMKIRALEILKEHNISDVARRAVDEFLKCNDIDEKARKASQDVVRKAVESVINDGIKKYSAHDDIEKMDREAKGLENKKKSKP